MVGSLVGCWLITVVVQCLKIVFSLQESTLCMYVNASQDCDENLRERLKLEQLAMRNLKYELVLGRLISAARMDSP